MRKLVLKMSVSADGFVGGPNGEITTWTNVPVESDLVAGIHKLKQQDGNFILAYGGAGFVQDLVKYGLIDEYSWWYIRSFLGGDYPCFHRHPTPLD